MGLLDKTKSTPLRPASGSSSNCNFEKSGNKKASYSLNDNYTENIVPNKLKQEQSESKCHDNPSFESENQSSEETKVILNSIHNNHKQAHLNLLTSPSSLLKISQETNNQKDAVTTNTTGAYAIASSTTVLYITQSPNQSQQQQGSQVSTPRSTYQIREEIDLGHGITSLTSYNTAEKLAAAAAAAVSESAATVVEIPNFGEELSSMMQQTRMDEIEITTGKKFESKISQSHGFTFGDGNNSNKNFTKSANLSSRSTIISDDDANLKLTGSSTYDLKFRRRRACQLKALVIFIAMITAGCIGCVFSYYFMKYKYEQERYLNYTQNMVNERASKYGSNKLEIVVPFNSTVQDLDDKSALVNKIQEIVYDTFVNINKTIEVIQLFELNEVAKNSYVAIIDVELKDAKEFARVTLLKENEFRIKVIEPSQTLKLFRETFKNITLSLNLNLESLNIDFSNIEILFDTKTSSKQSETARLFTNTTQIFTTTSTSTTTSTPESTTTTQVSSSTESFISVTYKLAPTNKIFESTSIISELTKIITTTVPSTTVEIEKTTTSEILTSTHIDPLPSSTVPVLESTFFLEGIIPTQKIEIKTSVPINEIIESTSTFILPQTSILTPEESKVESTTVSIISSSTEVPLVESISTSVVQLPESTNIPPTSNVVRLFISTEESTTTKSVINLLKSKFQSKQKDLNRLLNYISKITESPESPELKNLVENDEASNSNREFVAELNIDSLLKDETKSDAVITTTEAIKSSAHNQNELDDIVVEIDSKDRLLWSKVLDQLDERK